MKPSTLCQEISAISHLILLHTQWAFATNTLNMVHTILPSIPTERNSRIWDM